MSDSIDSTSTPDNSSVLRSWHDNARAWTEAIRLQKIQSRTLVTNQAIVDAIMVHTPATVLDLGCGEGWLSWQLAARGMHVLGVDAVHVLIEAAQGLNLPDITPPDFYLLDYQQIADGALQRRFDLIVCNFSLLDKEGVAALLRCIPTLLNPDGQLLIQTLHPDHVGEAGKRADGWREESWSGIGDNFSGKAPWYFRTLTSWRKLFVDSGLQLVQTIEPVHPHTGLPASIIFCLQR